MAIQYILTGPLFAEMATGIGAATGSSSDEGECGDPIFIDTALPGYPVYTAWQGKGRWEPKPIAVSLDGLREALAAVARAAKGREDPVALEQNPISVTERESVLQEIRHHNPDIAISGKQRRVTFS